MRPRFLPTEEIRFAARTGFLSKPIWDEFFAQGSERWKRRQWQLLLGRDLFKRHPSRLPKDVLVLHRKNREVRRIVGDTISMPPFAPQIEHDEHIAKICLSLMRSGSATQVRFESELKREDWKPNVNLNEQDKAKYSDAILFVDTPSVNIQIAIEVELSKKNPKRYRQILSSYAQKKELRYVLYLARSQPIFESLKTAMRETYYPDSERPIGFCLLDEWLKDPTKAPIHFSNRVTSLDRIRLESLENDS